MRKFNLLSCLLFLLTAVQCSDNNIQLIDDPNGGGGGDGTVLGSFYFTTADGGVDSFVYNENVTVPFAINSASALSKDVTISLSADGGEEGVTHSLSASSVVLPAGETVIPLDIVFTPEIFNYEDDRMVKIRVNATSKDVKMNDLYIDFYVRKYIPGAPEITLSVDPEYAEVYYEDLDVTITLTSNRALEEDTVFTLSADGATENVDYRFVNKQVTMSAGQTTATATMTLIKESFVDDSPTYDPDVPGSKEKLIGIKLDSAADVNLMKSVAWVNALGGYFRTQYCKPNHRGSWHYMITYDIGYFTYEPYNTDNSKAFYYDYVNNLERGPIGRIEIPTGTSKLIFYPGSINSNTDVYRAVCWVDWNQNGSFADDGDLMASQRYVINSVSNGGKLEFDFKVPDNIKPGFSTVMRIGVANDDTLFMQTSGCRGSLSGGLAMDMMDVRVYVVAPKNAVTFTGNLANENIVVKGADVTRTLTATVAQDAVEDITIDVNVSGAKETSYTLSSKQIVIPKGSKTASATITFKKEAYQVALQSENYTIELTPKNTYVAKAGTGTKATCNVKGYGTKPTVYMNIATTDITVETGVDKVVTFQVVLSEAENSKPVTVAIAVDPSFTEDKVKLSTKSVTFPAGNTTPVNVTITFSSGYFVYSNEPVEVPISVTTSDAITDPGRDHATFTVKGSINKPAAKRVYMGSAPAAAFDVTNGNYTYKYTITMDPSITEERSLKLSFDSDSKASFEGGAKTKIVTFSPDGPKLWDNLVQYVDITVLQSGFAIDQSSSLSLIGENYGVSNLVFHGDGSSQVITFSVIRRAAGTYCSITGPGNSNFYISSITIGDTVIPGPFTQAYNDRTNIEVSLTSQVTTQVGIHKNAGIASGNHYAIAYIDRENDGIFSDAYAETLYLADSDRVDGKWENFAMGSGPADKSVTLRTNQNITIANYAAKSRLRIVINQSTAAADALSNGCSKGDTYTGIVVDVTYKK